MYITTVYFWNNSCDIEPLIGFKKELNPTLVKIVKDSQAYYFLDKLLAAILFCDIEQFDLKIFEI